MQRFHGLYQGPFFTDVYPRLLSGISAIRWVPLGEDWHLVAIDSKFEKFDMALKGQGVTILWDDIDDGLASRLPSVIRKQLPPKPTLSNLLKLGDSIGWSGVG